jgi:NACalpha-BTF3-like transcription factor
MSTASAPTATASPTPPPPVRAPADEAPPAYATADAATDATTADADSTTTAAANDADLELVMAQCGVPMETACELLNQANGDIVEAIAYHLNPALAASEAHKEAQEWALVDADEGEADEDARQAREVQAKLAELRDITTAKNAMLDAQMRARKAAAAGEGGC